MSFSDLTMERVGLWVGVGVMIRFGSVVGVESGFSLGIIMMKLELGCIF